MTTKTKVHPSNKNKTVSMALMTAEGKNQREIAKEFGVSQGTVSKRLKTPVAQKILNKAHQFQVALLPKANKVLASLLNSDNPDMQFKAVSLVHKNTGITPSHTLTQYIQTIYSQTNIGALTPAGMEYVRYLKDRQKVPQCRDSDDNDAKQGSQAIDITQG